MSTEIVKTERNLNLTGTSPGTYNEAFMFAKALVASQFFPTLKDANQGVVKIAAGQEMGMGPIASVNGIHFINNRITYEAGFMASALKRRGYYYRALELTDERVKIEFSHPNMGVLGVSAFSMEDAKLAGLNAKDVWKKYPRNMMWARAMSNGCKWYCADVFGGAAHTPEELGADVNADGRPVEPHFIGASESPTRSAPQSDEAKALTETILGRPREPEANYVSAVTDAIREMEGAVIE